jgi:hypothetical protein
MRSQDLADKRIATISSTDPAIARIATSIDCEKRKPQLFGSTNRSLCDLATLMQIKRI